MPKRIPNLLPGNKHSLHLVLMDIMKTGYRVLLFGNIMGYLCNAILYYK